MWQIYSVWRYIYIIEREREKERKKEGRKERKKERERERGSNSRIRWKGKKTSIKC